MTSKLWLKFLVIILLSSGVFFRFANLDSKIYWVDEVTTSLRISGYTKQEVIQEISESGVVGVEELQKYQRLSPEKDFHDTLEALMKSPEHAPLYFVMARLWVQFFGSSIAATRSLSAVISLLALPCIYWLCLELFKSQLVGWVALALLNVSPFFVAYAQEARPYSLWIVTILLSSVALLRAMRLNDRTNWCFYTFTLTLGLYTSLLSIFVSIGQSIYAIAIEKFRYTKTVKSYLIAYGFGLIAFAPWLLVIYQNWHNLQDNTTWMRVPMDILPMVAVWIYGSLIIFADFPVSTSFEPIVVTGFFIHLALLVLVCFSIYFVCTRSQKRTWLFVLTLTVVTHLILILIDLIVEGQSSTAPRYMIPSHLGIQLAIAYLLTNKMFFASASIRQQQNWKLITLTIILIGLISCVANIERSPKYQKTRNLHNITIAFILNQAKSPILIAEPEEAIDVLSLGQVLEPKVKVKLLTHSKFHQFINERQNIFLFNPSESLRDKIKKEQQFKLVQIYKPKLLIPDEISLSLWTVERLDN